MSDENKKYDVDDILGLDNFEMGKGIKMVAGFDMSIQAPLDSRTVVRTMDDLANMSKDIIHMGLLVYVLEENKLYQYKEILQEDKKTYRIGWGPVESDVSAIELHTYGDNPDGKEITDEIDFSNTMPLLMQKNRVNFFPIVHEDYLFVDLSGKTLIDKYQTRNDQKLLEVFKDENEKKDVVASINNLYEWHEDDKNTINKKIDDEIKALTDKHNTDITNLTNQHNEELEALNKTITEDIGTAIANLTKQHNEDITELNNTITNNISTDIANLTNKHNTDITNLTNNLFDGVDDFLAQIQINKDNLK